MTGLDDVCLVCGAVLVEIKAKQICPKCHQLSEGCCEGCPGPVSIVSGEMAPSASVSGNGRPIT